MATLHARGRVEVLRIQREEDVVPADWERVGVTWRRWTRAFMRERNGRITALEKYDAKFKDQTRITSWGWKVRGKVKEGLTPEQLRDNYLINNQGWKVVAYTPNAQPR